MPGRSCQRTCPVLWAPLVPERRGGQARVRPAAGGVGGRQEGGAPGGLSGERLAHDSVLGIGLVPLGPFHEYTDPAHF